jgi:AraC-like DNA-binding protein
MPSGSVGNRSTRVIFDTHPYPPRTSDQAWFALLRTIESTVPRGPYASDGALLRQHVRCLPHGEAANYDFVCRAMMHLYATRGQVRMTDLAAHCDVSLRHFERQFKLLTGISPKRLARIVRFEAVLHRLLQAPLPPMDDLAYEFGYTDQAHMTNDFKAMTACTPQQFILLAEQRMKARFYKTPDPGPGYGEGISTAERTSYDNRHTALERHASYRSGHTAS